MDKAGKMKHELEELQRAAKRARDAKGEQWTTRYFEVPLNFPLPLHLVIVCEFQASARVSREYEFRGSMWGARGSRARGGHEREWEFRGALLGN